MTSSIKSLAAGNSRGGFPPTQWLRYQPSVIVALAFAAGIALDRLGLPAANGFTLLILWLVGVGCLGIWWWLWRGNHSAMSAWLLLAAIVGTGGAWHELRWNHFSDEDVSRYVGLESAPACVMARALTAPQVLPAPPPTPLRAIPGGERCLLEVQVRRIRGGTQWLDVDGRCQLVVDGDLVAVEPGDEIQIFAQLRRTRPPMNPGEFDFAAHARAEGRLASLAARSPECVTVVAPNQHWSLNHFVAALRECGQQLLGTYIGPQRSGLAAAILLGVREELPYQETIPFFLTGTIHLLVVSGLNVAILATGLYSLVWIGWVPRRVALALIVAIVVTYALVAGADPPVLRAAVLVVLVCVGAWTGRQGVAFNSLAAAAVITLALNPAQLFQTGSQLSFLCVAILIWVGQSKWYRSQAAFDPLDRLIAESRPWYVQIVRTAVRWTLFLLVTSTAVWLATLPLVLYRFHVASPVALLIAPAVWLIALIAMWSGFITLACGWLMPFVAVVAGTICRWSLGALVAVVDWAEGLPGGHLWAPGPARWWVVGFYLGLIAVMLWGRSRLSTRWQMGLAAAWIVIGLAPPLARHVARTDEFRCTFVAMGHGTCVVLETPDGQTLLYDAGSLGSPAFATQSVADYLWHRGILRIDGLILSHADVDHYNAVPGLLERFRVGVVYVSPMMFDWYGATGPSGAPQVLRQAIDAAGVPIREIWAGDRLRVGDVAIDVIHPPHSGVVGSDNANSITVAVQYAGRRLLLPGDLESPGLEDVIAEAPVDCDILMAPHHGSRRSDPPGFTAWTTPEWVVISGGADPDVERAYAANGAKVLNTGKQGAIEFTCGRDRVTATFFRRRAVR